jgi:hypothetical protein
MREVNNQNYFSPSKVMLSPIADQPAAKIKINEPKVLTARDADGFGDQL